MTWSSDGLTRWTVALAGGEGRHSRPSSGEVDPTNGQLTEFLWDLLIHPEKLWNRIWGALTDWLDAVGPLAIATTVTLAATSLIVVALVRLRDRRLARDGRRIRVLPPPDVPTDGACVLWTALHGLIRPRWKRLLMGQPSLAWEVVAQRDETEISLWVPPAVPLDWWSGRFKPRGRGPRSSRPRRSSPCQRTAVSPGRRWPWRVRGGSRSEVAPTATPFGWRCR